MAIINKPDEHIFASNAKRGEVDAFPDLLRGWGISFDQTGGIPPMEWFNALFKRADEKHGYLMQHGLPEWSATQDYPAGAFVQHKGLSYKSLRANKNKSPEENNSADWQRWGFTLTEIAKATLTQSGIVQLTNNTNSDSETLALTAKAGKKLAERIEQDFIPNSKKSSAVNSNSEDDVATPKAVKAAYDKAVEAKKAADAKQSPATTLSGYGISNFKVEGFVGDVNTLKTDGLYAVAQASRSQNLPVPGNGCHIQVIGGGDSTWCRQIAYITYSGDMYERHQMSYLRDEWSPWKKLVLDGLSESQLTLLLQAKADATAFTALHDLFIGVPIPYPLATVPAGCLAMNGQRFDKNRYPKLGQKYPSGVLPDLRGEFIRGWDNGRGVDAGRGILSAQGDAIRNITGSFKITDVSANDYCVGAFNAYTKDKPQGRDSDENLHLKIQDNAALSHWFSCEGIEFNASRIVPTANENRPRNIAFHYICLAA